MLLVRSPFIEKTMQFTERINQQKFDGMICEYLATTKPHTELMVQCPVVGALAAATGTPLQPHSWMTPRTIDMLSKPFFDIWHTQTAMSAVPGAEPWMCTLSQADVARKLLPQFLPGLRSPRFAYLAQRLAAAAASSCTGKQRNVRSVDIHEVIV